MITDVVSTLPGWAAGLLLLLVVIGWCSPKVLRALDDRRIAKAACARITTEQGAVEALRIRNSPRRIIGRLSTASTSRSTASAEGAPAGDAVARDSPESEPGDEPP
ncbi:MAG: hypothetical protein ACRES5_02160 [Pseudomonas sp.]